MSRILIISNNSDTSTLLVQIGLTKLGHEVANLEMTEFPANSMQSWTISEEIETFESELESLMIGTKLLDTVWCRHPDIPNIESVNVNADAKNFVERVYREYTVGTYVALRHGTLGTAQQSFWVNPLESISRAKSKILQLIEAKRCGLLIPDTLISNDTDKVHRFLTKHSNRIICKAFVSHRWTLDNGQRLPAITSGISTLEGISPSSIRVAPSIYQPLLDKDCEFRILILGSHHFVLRMDVDSDSPHDRPYSLFDPSVVYAVGSLPEVVLDKCHDLTKRLGLVFAALDVIKTVSGEFIFLEVNECGQFAFMEEQCPELPIIDAMCHFLAFKTLDNWSESPTRLTFDEIRRHPDVRAREAALARRAAEQTLSQMRSA